MTFWVILLIVVAVSAVAVAFSILITGLEKRKTSVQYDERQKMIRGRASGWAHVAGFAYFIVLVYLDLILAHGVQAELYALIMLGLLVEALVFTAYCIWNGAMLPLFRSAKQWICIMGLWGVLQLWGAVLRINQLTVSVSENGELVKIAFHQIPLQLTGDTAMPLVMMAFGIVALLMGAMGYLLLLRQKEE